MIHHNLLLSIIVLFLNSSTIIIFGFNISCRLRAAIGSKTKEELDFYFKLIMLSIIGIIMSAIAFYIGVKIWLRTAYTALDVIINLRLVYAVLMTLFSLVVSIIDRNYNPFKVK